MKTLMELAYSGMAYVCTLAAAASISTTSWLMMYQPDMLSEEDIG